MSLFSSLSTVVLILVVLGLWQRYNRKVHIPLMLTAFALDLGLVLAIELQRQAVEKLIDHSVSAFVYFHAGISLLVLVFYVILLVLGLGILKGQPKARHWHRLSGIGFIVLRLTNYITSFWV